MFHWIPYAMVRIALFFMAGILAGIYQPQWLHASTVGWLAAALFVAYLVVWRWSRRSSAPVATGMLGLATVSLLGYGSVLVHTESRHDQHLLTVSDRIDYYEAVVTRYSDEKEHSWKTEARVRSINTQGRWQPVEGKILLYLSKQDFKEPLQYGQVLLVRGAPQELTPPANPGEFDYRRFLSFRQIHHQHFLRQQQVVLLQMDPPSRLMHYAIKVRHWADRELKSVVRGPREQAIASALVLGITDGLDNELLRAYAATGAMHVLAVSGLHVGIIYWLILLLFKPLQRLPYAPSLLAAVSLALLWSYAFVTGLSPSVLRAVTMFSFIAVARATQQQTNIYNTLAASAFCLLLFDPYLIMSVGFQLSFLAVLGIVYLQPLLYQWWEPSFWLWDQVWKITCVSVAAQLATFTLGLLYFHQFPNYFLFSNLFVIPGSFAVLIVGLLALAVSILPLVAVWVGALLTWIIKAMNYLVFAVEGLPFSLLEGIHLSTLQSWLLMIALAAGLAIFTWRKFQLIWVSAIAALMFAFTELAHVQKNVQVTKLTVYRIAGHSAIDLIDNGAATFLADSALHLDVERLRFHVRPNRLIGGVSKVQKKPTVSQGFSGFDLIVWRGLTVMHLKDADAQLPEWVQVDLLIVSNNSVRSWSKISKKVHFGYAIVDSSNSWHAAEQLRAEAGKSGVRMHSVLHEGAFDYEI